MSLQEGGSGGTREVHKNGWLKKMPSQERRLSVMAPFTKPPKGEKVWVSFCVHDETEGWLEFYENRRSAFSHNPLLRTSLSRCLHVSPSIRVQEDNEHVFAITLEGEVIKLGAQTREQMIEWIDALRTRLRELGVLTPKDNLYSREPEGGLRSPMLRNPASPLPPTPTAFQFPPHAMEFREEVSSLHSLRLGGSPAGSITLPALPSMHSLNSVSSGHSSDPNTSPSSVVTYVRPDHPPLNRRSSFRASLPSSPTTPASSTGSLTYLRSPPGPQAGPRDQPPPPPQPQPPPPPPPHHVIVINVPSPSTSVFNFDSVGAALESSGSMATSQLYGPPHTPQTPHTPDTPMGEPDTSPHGDLYQLDPNTLHLRVSVGNSLGAGGGGGGGGGSGGGGGRPPLPPGQRGSGYGAGAYGAGAGAGASAWPGLEESSYEPLFLATSEVTPVAPQAPQTGLLRRRSEHRRSGRREHARRAASVGPVIAPRPKPGGGGGGGGGSGSGGGGGSGTGPSIPPGGTPGGSQGHPQSQYQVGQDGRPMSLREQQVIRLQREIAHQAGVRLTLRKKDCCHTVAFVNVFDHVYVAGWKQREHPYLHNTFHIGDRLVSVCGVQVASAGEVNAVIKNEPSAMIEFIIRRVPHGRVFALKRETEGQPLGIVREGNTAEIREIVCGGLASQHGVPPKAQTVDTLSVCSWVLTEINHRPLNLFFKHLEIADRLNAVGRDISILVQPMDLVRQLKKGLKQIKAYKDYIVM